MKSYASAFGFLDPPLPDIGDVTDDDNFTRRQGERNHVHSASEFFAHPC